MSRNTKTVGRRQQHYRPDQSATRSDKAPASSGPWTGGALFLSSRNNPGILKPPAKAQVGAGPRKAAGRPPGYSGGDASIVRRNGGGSGSGSGSGVVSARGLAPQRQETASLPRSPAGSIPPVGHDRSGPIKDGAVPLGEGVAAVAPGARGAEEDDGGVERKAEQERERRRRREEEEEEEERHGIKIGYEVAGVYVARADGTLPSTEKIPLPPLYYMLQVAHRQQRKELEEAFALKTAGMKKEQTDLKTQLRLLEATIPNVGLLQQRFRSKKLGERLGSVTERDAAAVAPASATEEAASGRGGGDERSSGTTKENSEKEIGVNDSTDTSTSGNKEETTAVTNATNTGPSTPTPTPAAIPTAEGTDAGIGTTTSAGAGKGVVDDVKGDAPGGDPGTPASMSSTLADIRACLRAEREAMVSLTQGMVATRGDLDRIKKELWRTLQSSKPDPRTAGDIGVGPRKDRDGSENTTGPGRSGTSGGEGGNAATAREGKVTEVNAPLIRAEEPVVQSVQQQQRHQPEDSDGHAPAPSSTGGCGRERGVGGESSGGDNGDGSSAAERSREREWNVMMGRLDEAVLAMRGGGGSGGGGVGFAVEGAEERKIALKRIEEAFLALKGGGFRCGGVDSAGAGAGRQDEAAAERVEAAVLAGEVATDERERLKDELKVVKERLASTEETLRKSKASEAETNSKLAEAQRTSAALRALLHERTRQRALHKFDVR
ncbi:unnamed protein product [Scytosiphon promiscuus]